MVDRYSAAGDRKTRALRHSGRTTNQGSWFVRNRPSMSYCHLLYKKSLCYKVASLIIFNHLFLLSISDKICPVPRKTQLAGTHRKMALLFRLLKKYWKQ